MEEECSLNFVRVEEWREEVIGLRPVYTDYGDVTEIISLSGQSVFDKRGLRSVQRAIGRCYAIDFEAQREQVARYLNRSGALPFYLSPQRIFIPLKMRKPRTSRDFVYGYIDYRYIAEIDGSSFEKTGHCRLTLNTGQAFDIFSHYTTAIQSRHLGQSFFDKLGHVPENPVEEQAIACVRAFMDSLRVIKDSLDRIENKLEQ